MTPNELLAEIAKKTGKPAVFYDESVHGSSSERWMNEGMPWLIKILISENGVIGAVDCGHGHDILWDGELFIGKHGIFTPSYVFITDYHGYPEGALFSRIGGTL